MAFGGEKVQVRLLHESLIVAQEIEPQRLRGELMSAIGCLTGFEDILIFPKIIMSLFKGASRSLVRASACRARPFSTSRRAQSMTAESQQKVRWPEYQINLNSN